VRQWLLDTVDYLLENSELDIVVRGHPAESRRGFDSEKVSLIISDIQKGSGRIKIISGDSDINTYDLMEGCRFGVVFASTTGIEIAMHQKNVIVGANVYYSRYSFCKSAENRHHYFKLLKDLISNKSTLPEKKSHEAAIVYSVFHNGLQWYYPFDKPSDYVGIDFNHFHETAEYKRCCSFLDALVMKKDEFSRSCMQDRDLVSGRLLGYH
jgi:hypothetical protein